MVSQMLPSSFGTIVLLIGLGGHCASACSDVADLASNKCASGVNWARQTGISQYPQWYDNYTILANSSFADWQMVLWHKALRTPSPQERNDTFATRDHDCPCPCTSTLPYECPANDDTSEIAIATSPITSTEAPIELPSVSTQEGNVEVAVPTPSPSVDEAIAEEGNGKITPFVIAAASAIAFVIVAYCGWQACSNKDRKKGKSKRALNKPRKNRAENEGNVDEKEPLTSAAVEPISSSLPASASYTMQPSHMPAAAMPAQIYHHAQPVASGHMLTTIPMPHEPAVTTSASIMPTAVAVPQHSYDVHSQAYPQHLYAQAQYVQHPSSPHGSVAHVQASGVPAYVSPPMPLHGVQAAMPYHGQ